MQAFAKWLLNISRNADTGINKINSFQQTETSRFSSPELFIFSSSSPEPLGHLQPNSAQSILGLKGFKVSRPFPRADKHEIGKIH